MDLIERIFQTEGFLYIACNNRNAFFTSEAVRNYNLWSCQKVCEDLTCLLDNIYIRFGLACDHLFGKLLFTWLSLVMSMMVSFVLSFFPRDVLDEILNLIESVSEDFPSYFWL